MTKHILIMAGGTGGHIIPALVVAQQLQQQGCTVSWLGTAHGLEAKLVPDHAIPLFTIAMKGVRKTSFRRLLLTPWLLLRSLCQAWFIFRRLRPQAVLCMGGFAALPGGIVAYLRRVPIVLHEQNSVAGATNKLVAHFSRHIFTAFDDVFPAYRRAVTIGNPMWSELLQAPSPQQRFHGRQGKLRLLVLGGSRGAKVLNKTVPQALRQLSSVFEVWQQCGQHQTLKTEQAYRAIGLSARISSFIEDTPQAYQWADLVICRAGSMTISELAAVGVAAIIVPFPLAVDDHQTRNAQALVKKGAAVLLRQSQLHGHSLSQVLESLTNRDKLLNMAQQARSLSKNNAAERLTRCLLHV